MVSTTAHRDEKMRAGLPLASSFVSRRGPRSASGRCPVTDIGPGLETRLHDEIHAAFRDCIGCGLSGMRPTSPLTGIVFFSRLPPDRDRAGPFGKEILIHKRGRVSVGLHFRLRAWRAADVAGRVALLRGNIVNSIARVRPKRPFDADLVRLLEAIDAAVEPTLSAVRHSFPGPP